MIVACAIDFSPASLDALHVAARLAAASKGDVALIVVDESDGRDERALRAAAEREIEAVRKWGASLSSLVVVRGDPPERIVDACRNARADVVVLGAHGRGRAPPTEKATGAVDATRAGARGAGRTAERVAATAPMPVLVVRDAPRLLAWLDGARALRVVLAASLEPSLEAARGFVAALRSLAACDVTAVHVSFPPEMWALLHARWPETILSDPPVAAPFGASHRASAVLERTLAERIGTLPGDGALHVRIDDTYRRPEDGVVAIAAREDADVIVLGAHRRAAVERLWFGSTAADVLRHAPQNVVVAPDVATRAELPHVSTVLVPIDSPEGAARAVAVACALAEPGGRVLLLHVEKRALDQAARATIRRDLFALAPAGCAKRGIAVETAVLVDDDVAAAVSAIAVGENADLVCMRARAHRAGHALLGSVLDRVIARCSCPVVAVRDEL